MRKLSAFLAALVVGVAGLAAAAPGQADPVIHRKGVATVYSVLYADGASRSAARAAVRAAGGTIVQENRAVGLARVRSTDTGFMAAVARQPALFGAARNVPVGRVPRLVQKGAAVEQDRTLGPPHARPKGTRAVLSRIRSRDCSGT